jgi:hypothetical protein
MAEQQQDQVDLVDKLSFLYGSDPDAHVAEALVLTCIDFRYFALIAQVIAGENLVGNYDHVILAGGTLGPLVDFPPTPMLHWQQTFLDHLTLSERLHKIKRVVVLDHRDCGAYKEFGILTPQSTPEEEFNAHRAQAIKLESLVRRFLPKLVFEAYLLELPCKVEPLEFLRDRKAGLKATRMV